MHFNRLRSEQRQILVSSNFLQPSNSRDVTRRFIIENLGVHIISVTEESLSCKGDWVYIIRFQQKIHGVHSHNISDYNSNT